MRSSQTPTETVSQTSVASEEDHEGSGAGQPDPKDKREAGEADAAHRGAVCVDGGDDPAAIRSVKSGAGFVLFFMPFDEACAGGEDCREGEEEAADDGAESLRDQSCDNADCSAECEADDPLVGFNSLDCGETSMDDHGGYLTISQNANEAANQTGMRVMVAVRARGFQRISMQLTHEA